MHRCHRLSYIFFYFFPPFIASECLLANSSLSNAFELNGEKKKKKKNSSTLSIIAFLAIFKKKETSTEKLFFRQL